MKIKTLCIVQARMSSSRLPGKMMLDLNGRPVIARVFNQLSYSKLIDKIILATSIDKSDDHLYEWALRNKTYCFRGSLDDVLDRFYNAALIYNPLSIVRITGDCPLIDPEIVDETINQYYEGKYDYFSNVDPPTFPDGMDTEIIKFRVLCEAWTNARLQSEREHVTLYIRNHREEYKTGCYKSRIDYSRFRLTLDNPEDYKLISEIYKLAVSHKRYLNLEDILNILEKYPELININKHINRNEGLIKSLKDDKIIK